MILNEKTITRLLALLKKEYPNSSEKDHKFAINGFIEYMMLAKIRPMNEVPMYSKSVDFVWHQFILDTREYSAFCQEYFGGYLHHNPNDTEITEISYYEIQNNKELKTLFIDLCKIRGINPFDLDDKIPFYFMADPALESINNIGPFIKTSINLDLNRNPTTKNKTWYSSLFQKKIPVNSNSYESALNTHYKEVNNSNTSLTDMLIPALAGAAGGILLADIIEDATDSWDRRRDDVIVTDDTDDIVTGPMIFDTSSCSSSTSFDDSSSSSNSSCSSISCSSSSCSSSSSSCSSSSSYSSCSSSSSSCSSSSCSSSSCSSSSCSSGF